MIATSALFLLAAMQVGPDPTAGALPDNADILERPARTETTENRALSRCLLLARDEPEDALDMAQSWRETAENELELAQSAHCLGLAMVRLDRLDEARRVFEQASAEVPDDNPGYRARLLAMAGNAAMAERRADLAQTLFGDALGHARLSSDAALIGGMLVDRARALVAENRAEEAVPLLAEARTQVPDDAQAWLLSATLSRRLERLGEAQKQIETAADLDPRDPQIGLEAGVIAALAGRSEDAARSFRSVLEVAPDSPQAERARGYLEQLTR